MKNRFLNVLALVIVVTVAGCNKELDTTPTQSIDPNTALNTSKGVEVALTGAYADLGNFDVYGGSFFVCGDLLGDVNELNWSGTYQGMTQIKNKAIPVDNIFVADTWLDSYKTINDVNNVLSALSVVTDDKRDRVEGEAKFIRGSLYFDLVRIFAKAWNDGDPNSNPGVPLVLTPTKSITPESQLPRNKVAEVYLQVINDLTDAVARLPETNGFFANKISAEAMLARVYLQQGDYANARDAANSAIDLALSNGFELAPTYYDAFASPANTSEDIFAMQVTSSSGTNNFNEFYSAYQRGDITIEDAHLNLYEATDDRLSLFYELDNSVYTGKFENLYGNVRLIRLAEMYLIRAEANFRLGTSTGAEPVDDINTIRARVLLDPYDAADLTLDKILSERKLELAFEGFTLHDAKRLQQDVGPFPWNSPKLIYPIPIREMRVNANLTQNEGYF